MKHKILSCSSTTGYVGKFRSPIFVGVGGCRKPVQKRSLGEHLSEQTIFIICMLYMLYMEYMVYIWGHIWDIHIQICIYVLISYILFLLFNEFWSCFTGTVFPCFRFPGGGPCLPSAYEKQLTPRIDQWLRVEQTGKLKHPVFFVLQNYINWQLGWFFNSKLMVSIRWFQFSWFGKWLLHQTSNSKWGSLGVPGTAPCGLKLWNMTSSGFETFTWNEQDLKNMAFFGGKKLKNQIGAHERCLLINLYCLGFS